MPLVSWILFLATWLLKSCLDVLARSIYRMVNLSLLSGHVPENWRTAVVLPLLKKPGLDLVYTHFRPVTVIFHSFPK